ncbi:MAG: M14 family zinc carboxypeptidase [Longimicrobiales bacterium]|nr:M14 family zinc carboxypeptidase [Longimicrobiales bacterium]
MIRRTLAAVALLGVLVAPLTAQIPQTSFERNGGTEYTPHLEMWEYLQDIAEQTTVMYLSSYGESFEGRELPYLVFSKPRVSTPQEAWSLGKPILFFNANVHGGERTLRESLLILARELATEGTEPNRLLEEVTLVMAPQINPDGFEAEPRSTRGNSWGIDMNRDWVKREQAALANYGLLINEWAPHLLVDGHNGGSFPYHITYQCTSHPAAEAALTEWCDFGIFPAIDERVTAAGYKSWFYTGGNETEWRGGGSQVRIGRNYNGVVNTVGILFESPGWQEDQAAAADAGKLAYIEVMAHSAENAEALTTMVRAARVETIQAGMRAEGRIPVLVENNDYEPQDRTITYEILDPEYDGPRDEADPFEDVITVTNDRLLTKAVVRGYRDLPYAYILPRQAIDAVAMLRRNGITVEQLTRPATLDTEAYLIEGVSFESEYDHAASVELDVADAPVQLSGETYPAGTYVVRTGQMRGRLVAHMLEPETEDNVIKWNTMDALLPLHEVITGEAAPRTRFGGDPGPPIVPIHKLMTPTALPLRIAR